MLVSRHVDEADKYKLMKCCRPLIFFYLFTASQTTGENTEGSTAIPSSTVGESTTNPSSTVEASQTTGMNTDGSTAIQPTTVVR